MRMKKKVRLTVDEFIGKRKVSTVKEKCGIEYERNKRNANIPRMADP